MGRGGVSGVATLIVGICTSRVGLWVFDMSVTQATQETVPERCRGVVGGVQHSLQNIFQMASFVAGIAFSDVTQFKMLVGISYGAVAAAVVIQGAGVYFGRLGSVVEGTGPT
mmetsp:Transcript_31404/g.62225  ORF Transcript_31404/g.62225 Transcript_31404/m.62225 type:complete len:112 (+) Transcript_31404:322-657(+)